MSELKLRGVFLDWVPRKQEMGSCMWKVYWGVLLGDTPGREAGREGGRKAGRGTMQLLLRPQLIVQGALEQE